LKTLVVVRAESKRVFGGYNNVGWKVFNYNKFFKDPEAKGFVFRYYLFRQWREIKNCKIIKI